MITVRPRPSGHLAFVLKIVDITVDSPLNSDTVCGKFLFKKAVTAQTKFYCSRRLRYYH